MKSIAAGKTTEIRLALHANFYKKTSDGRELALLSLKTGTPFKEVAQQLGPVKTIFLISEVIRRYCSQFNVSKNMTPDQIEDIAGEIYLDFKDRKGNAVMLEEIILIFDRAARGDFRDKKGNKILPFDRIDRALIEEILDNYFENDRTQAVWQIEDERKKIEMTTEPEPRLLIDRDSDAPTIGEIYTLYAGKPGTLKLQKLINEGLSKYGTTGNNDAGAVPGDDITAAK